MQPGKQQATRNKQLATYVIYANFAMFLTFKGCRHFYLIR
jgi:hypothetical protein